MTERPLTPPGKRFGRRPVEAIGALAVAGLLVLFAWYADGQMVTDAAYSPLYEFTLRQAYSRFHESDARVALGPRSDPLDELPRMAGRDAAANNARQGHGHQRARSQHPGGQAAEQRGHAAASRQPSAHYQRGQQLLQQQQYPAARAAFEKAVQERPRDALALHALADTLRLLNEPDAAIATYRRVLAANPVYYCCHVHIGDIEKARGNTAAAEKAYAAAIAGYERQLEQPGAGGDVARYHLARLLATQGEDLARPIALAEEAVAHAPDQMAYSQLLADLYSQAGRREEACDLYRRLAEKHPQYAAFFEQRIAALTRAPGPPAPGESARGPGE